MENPDFVLAEISVVAGIVPASVAVDATPSIITEPDVGAFPAPAELVAVGAPALKHHAI